MKYNICILRGGEMNKEKFMRIFLAGVMLIMLSVFLWVVIFRSKYLETGENIIFVAGVATSIFTEVYLLVKKGDIFKYKRESSIKREKIAIASDGFILLYAIFLFILSKNIELVIFNETFFLMVLIVAFVNFVICLLAYIALIKAEKGKELL